ncbi:hypothetical protein E4T50_03350 [Aureobasidium sp. EXF-12298]|nr:hypothetical protein E4T50_03350 [Aureobasidium sp. EXF-12298]KAI4765080.1 hypothetical protein E4T51_01902 [Aureobasidium sp. EXF-12344]KAI4785037.1 hypothetical protein E4T52_00047 [Aureobasidium sp. EXF-3400]
MSTPRLEQGPAAGAVSSVHKIPPRACFTSTYVTIEVGPKKKTYVIHKELLIFYSDYFRGAFNGSFKEATEGKICLHNESEDVFDVFNKFLYSRLIADDKNEKFSWDKLVDIWLFGDKYIIPSLQNVAMDTIINKVNSDRVIPTNQISKIWEQTLPSSALRKYILERSTYKLSAAEFLKHEDYWTREALLGLIETHFNRDVIEKLTFPARPKCYFHVHKEGEEC